MPPTADRPTLATTQPRIPRGAAKNCQSLIKDALRAILSPGQRHRILPHPTEYMFQARNLMPELPDNIHEQITSLSAKGDSLSEEQKFPEAIETYWQAWDLLPEPKQN